MQVLVRKSDIAADCTCSICGQGFRLYWENGTAEQQARAHIEVRDAIHAQHLHNGGCLSACAPASRMPTPLISRVHAPASSPLLQRRWPSA